MLSKQQCPHTGIINFFTPADPFVSVGSITRRQRDETEFHWRWYDASRTISGIAKDMRSAEARLKRARRSACRKPS